MSDDKDQRTEPATAARRRTAREEGRVVVSRDVTTAAALLSALAALVYWGPELFDGLLAHLGSSLEVAGESRVLEASELEEVLAGSLLALCFWVAPVAVVVWLGTLGVGLLQTQGLFRWGGLLPAFRRIAPGSRGGRMASPRGLLRLSSVALKLLALSVVLAISFAELFDTSTAEAGPLLASDLSGSTGALWEFLIGVSWTVVWAVLAVAAVDSNLKAR